jgi:hypothetical protein
LLECPELPEPEGTMEIDMSAYREASKIGLVDIIAFKKGKNIRLAARLASD